MKLYKVKKTTKHQGKVYGPGSIIASLTGTLGITKCGDCADREVRYNQKADSIAKAIGIRKA